MSTPLAPVYDLAGKQEDPLFEEILALLWTDAPVSESQSPGDTHSHWQWAARGRTRGSTLWRSVGKPITDDTPALVASRAEAALAELITRKLAAAVSASAVQSNHTRIDLTVTVTRPRGSVVSIGFVLDQGVFISA